MNVTSTALKRRFILLGVLLTSLTAWCADLRIGIIGCDTSHVVAFTEILNNPAAKDHVPGGKVVAAFRGGSPDLPGNAGHLDEYTKTLREKYGVKMCESIQELCQAVDVVLLESVDGRPHLEQVKPVLAARKPVYIDKPMAGSLRDVIEIFELAKKAKVPVFSSSSLRFAKSTLAARADQIGKISYAETYGPCSIEPHHPDLFWYGVHGVESLFTVMGTGCQSVQRGTTADGKIEVSGMWGKGRKGVFREDKGFRGHAKGDKGEMDVGAFDGYEPLVEAIMKFFQTGIAPVKPEETIEVFAFMEAADESKREGGAPVKIKDIIKQAKARK
jgi:predicted dehydrogenase